MGLLQWLNEIKLIVLSCAVPAIGFTNLPMG